MSRHRAPSSHQGAAVARSVLGGAGELLVTAGIVLSFFAAYLYWGTAAEVNSHQQQLAQQFDRRLTTTPSSNPGTSATPAEEPGDDSAPEPDPDKVIGRLYLPAIGKRLITVEGVGSADLRYAPGHYPESADAGQPGNFAIAGHRNRAAFWDLDQLAPGMRIYFETSTDWYSYEVVERKIVEPGAVEEVAPAPPGRREPSLITLTTCNPKFDNYQRLVVHGKLVGSQPRAAGRPSGLDM